MSSGAASPGRPQVARAGEICLLGLNLTSPRSGFKGCGSRFLLAGCEHHSLRSMTFHVS